MEDKLQADVERLRRRGLSYERIAKQLGVGQGTVYRRLNPDAATRQRAASRAWKDRNRDKVREWESRQVEPCPKCGEPMTRGARQCRTCYDTRARERSEEIVKLWAEGLTRQEIAARVGMAYPSFCVELHRLRSMGYDLPLRTSPEQRRAAAIASMR